MFLSEGEVYAFDHELAFSFVFTLPSLLSPRPYALNDTDVNAAKNHFFFPMLAQYARRIDWEKAFDPFDRFQQEYWPRMVHYVPAEWQDATVVQRIQARLMQVFDNLPTFRSEIWNKLLHP